MTRRDHTKLPRASSAVRLGKALCLGLVLGGCALGGGSPLTSMQAFSPAGRDAALAPSTPGTTAETSAVIANLKSRSAILPDQGPYDQIAQSVLAASRGRALTSMARVSTL